MSTISPVADIEVEFAERALIDLPAVVVVFEQLVAEIFDDLLDEEALSPRRRFRRDFAV